MAAPHKYSMKSINEQDAEEEEKIEENKEELGGVAPAEDKPLPKIVENLEPRMVMKYTIKYRTSRADL